MFKTKFLIGFVCLVLPVIAKAQRHLKVEVNTQGAGLGLVCGNSAQYSGGFSVVRFDQDFTGIGFGVESPLYHTIHHTTDNRPILAPRLSIEHHKNFLPVSLAARVNLLYYTNFAEGVWAFRPELGLTMKTNIYLFYGYHIGLGKVSLIPRLHQLTLGFTLPAVN